MSREVAVARAPVGIALEQVLRQIPGDLGWLVCFRLAGIAAAAPAGMGLDAAFLLPPGTLTRDDRIVVLTPQGRYRAGEDGALRPVTGGAAPLDVAWRGLSMLDRYADLLAPLAVDGADCIGVGRLDGRGPVAMAVRVEEGIGRATASFDHAPPRARYELLPAVGVRYLGEETVGRRRLVRFEHRLPEHLLAGMLAGFTRTHHCNLFFLAHGEIDAGLEAGLHAAAEARLRAATGALLAVAVRSALEARREPRAMTCVPPPPRPPFPYGDLVPLGLLLRALRRFPGEPAAGAAAELLSRHLAARRQDGLWPFQTGGLATATDSAFVLLGHRDPGAAESLGAFLDEEGGVVPQRSSDAAEPGRMRAAPANRHWRQADLGTTCLARWVQREAGLPPATPLSYLTRRFADRSALFFANPHLVDWCLAEAIQDEPAAGPLREKLAAEIVAGVNPDWSFGRYDVAFSTALGILALAALGRRGRLLRAAQLQLLAELQPLAHPPLATPFFYTFAAGATGPAAALQGGRVRVAGHLHELHFLEDTHRHVATAVALMALAEPCDPATLDLPEPSPAPEVAHGRYRCTSATDYVCRHALPPYLPAGHA